MTPRGGAYSDSREKAAAPRANVPRLRRRSKRSLRARLRTYWVLAAFVAAASAYALWSLVTSPLFRLQSLDVVGLSRVSRADVVARAAIDPSANIWLVDKAAIEGRIERLPFVHSAHVHRALPAHVRIAIVERVPDGCVVGRDGAFTIDADQRVLQPGCADPRLTVYRRDDLPAAPTGAFLHDEALARLRADARTLGTAVRYRSFGFGRFGDLEATMPDGIVVRFGDDGDLTAKAALVDPILAQIQARLGRVVAIDLRAPAAPVVQYR